MRISSASRGLKRDSRVAIKATKIAMTMKNIGTYLMICEGCQFHMRVWERFNTHDGATLLPHFDVEDGCVYLL
jgi:hypothetical protein